MFGAPEGSLGVGGPSEQLGLALEHFVQRGKLGGDVGQEPVVECHQSQEFLEALERRGLREFPNCLDFLSDRCDSEA